MHRYLTPNEKEELEMERRQSVLRDLSRIKGRGHIKQDTLFMACVSHFSRSFHRFNLNFELWTWFANWRRFSAVDTAGLISSHFHDYNKKMRFLMVRRLWLSGVLPAHLLVRPAIRLNRQRQKIESNFVFIIKEIKFR